MPTYKLDSNGNYLPFPGYTVICKLGVGEESDVWHNLHTNLNHNKRITDYYSILPFSTWHVTAINLFTQRAVESNQLEWDTYVASKKDFLNELTQVLGQSPLTPVISYLDLHTEGALQLNVVLDPQSVRRIEALASRYGYERNIPHRFHVTLGYQYKELPHSHLEELKAELTSLIQTCFNTRTIELQPAQLCYFDDMTAYIPWHKSFSYSTSMFAQNHIAQDDSVQDPDFKLSK